MTFSNPVFYWVFLPISILGFAFSSHFNRRLGLGFLAFMSLLFYAAWSPQYLLLLVASMLFNLAISHLIARSTAERMRSLWLCAGIVINLGVLVYYKYLFPSLNALTTIGLTQRHWGSVILPLGISFFTFTQIAYLVDLRQGIAAREELLSYVLFVSFFPHLIAGPIVHHGEIMPQFRQKRFHPLKLDDLVLGLTWFAMGLFKKAVIADNISPSADKLFNSPAHVGAWDTWFGVIAYAMQLYFDFSGYSDMALGLARMFSIRFPINFNSPYKASSIIDFWQRWHITLSSYIMDYLYSPILKAVISRRQRMGKKSTKKVQATLEGFSTLIAYPTMAALLIAGIWHGAGLQFLLYGLMHGMYLTVNHAWRTFVPSSGFDRRLLSPPVAVALTFVCVLLAFVMFRANGTGSALMIYGGLFGWNGAGRAWSSAKFAVIGLLLAMVWLAPNTQEILGEQQKDELLNWNLIPNLRWRPTLLWWAAATATFVIGVAYSTAKSTFLYFQF